jgi:hypothetical protein
LDNEYTLTEEQLIKRHTIEHWAYNEILDVVSQTIIFNDLKTLFDAAGDIIKKDEVVRAIDRWKNPSISGYRDIIVNIKVKNGFICEIRLNVKQMFEAREKYGGHELLKLAIGLQEDLENGNITRKEADHDHILIMEMLNNFYGKATALVYANIEANASSLDIKHPSFSVYTDKYGVGDKVLSEFTRNKWRLLAANIS